MPEPELFWISGSPPSWRVMLALETKAIRYRSTRLDTAQREHKTPRFLAINPRGQVPVLRAGKLVIRESLAIIAFLDRLQPEPPLFDRNSAETARIWQQVFEFENHLRPALATIARILFHGDQNENSAELARALATVNSELPGWETALAEHGPQGVETPSAAEIVLYPGLKWLERALAQAADNNDCIALGKRLNASPALRKLNTAIESLPGYDRTYPPHWRNA